MRVRERIHRHLKPLIVSPMQDLGSLIRPSALQLIWRGVQRLLSVTDCMELAVGKDMTIAQMIDIKLGEKPSCPFVDS